MGNLLPCPWCGSPAGEISHAFTPQQRSDGTVYEARRVECSKRDCIANLATRPSEADAIALWNTRAHPPAPLRVKLPQRYTSDSRDDWRLTEDNSGGLLKYDDVLAMLKEAGIEVEP